MYNKWMLSYLKGFRFPISLMLIHQGTCSILSAIAIHVFGAVPALNLTWPQIFANVFPVRDYLMRRVQLLVAKCVSNRLPLSFLSQSLS
jgi:hypothetical protein